MANLKDTIIDGDLEISGRLLGGEYSINSTLNLKFLM